MHLCRRVRYGPSQRRSDRLQSQADPKYRVVPFDGSAKQTHRSRLLRRIARTGPDDESVVTVEQRLFKTRVVANDHVRLGAL